jgi:hypothetical protein
MGIPQKIRNKTTNMLFGKDKPAQDVWSPAPGNRAGFSVPPTVSPAAESAARLTSLRSAFRAPHGAPRGDFAPARDPAPPREPTVLPPGTLVVIRNCSTKRVLSQLLNELGGKEEDISGRYFVPTTQDLAKIHQYASANGFFVKESLVRNVMVLDLMVDRDRRVGGFVRRGGYPGDMEDTL